jgi:hypothetical protein
MKVGVITLMTALLFALPALAGPVDPCGPVDTDSDGTFDLCDNCSSSANPTQLDADSDGFGNRCDADFDQSGIVGGGDFSLLGQNWNQAIPPGGTGFPPVDADESGIIGGGDFSLLGQTWNQLPGPACGNPQGTPCPHVP